LWIGRSPAGLVASTQPIANGVRVADTGRLKILETLAPQALSLAVYSDEQQQSTAWVLHFLGARFTLALSAEVWRGFSGEGQALRALMKDDAEMETKLPMLRAKLAWQSGLDPVSLASELNCSESLIADGLRILGVSGWVGYDLTAGAYFHRVLPLDLSSVEDMHPRLKGARQLLADDAVRLRTGAPLTATVSSNSVEHTVREVEGELRCTCPWFAKHQGQRGPCKHVLAVEAMQVRSRAS
jgi:hypothetical protein